MPPILERQRPTNDLFEMFSVVMNGVDEDHLSGDITILHGFGNIYLFKRQNPGEEDITVFQNKDGEKELLLTGPTDNSVSATDQVMVCFTFKNVMTDKACEDSVGFNSLNRCGCDFNRLYSATIGRQGLGSITFKYAVFDSSISAKVEVLVDNTINSHRVIGEIYAQNSLHKIRTCLFHKKKKNTACVISDDDGSQRNIPLSKSIVALPNVADLRIEFDLTDSETGIPIVIDGVAIFQTPRPETYSYARKVLATQNVGSIQVIVTWALVTSKFF